MNELVSKIKNRDDEYIVVTINSNDLKLVKGMYIPQDLKNGQTEIAGILSSFDKKSISLENELNQESVYAHIPWNIVIDAEPYEQSKSYQSELESRNNLTIADLFT